MPDHELTPKEIVAELDKYIIGQTEAKKSVAIALRNRYRRRRLPASIKDEVMPKNIIMIGPTGVGKTEIARRLARLANAPFVKVEATKFTEVGYVGRDVESIIRDLIETAIRIVKKDKTKSVQERANRLAEGRLLYVLAPLPTRKKKNVNPLNMFFSDTDEKEENGSDNEFQEHYDDAVRKRQSISHRLTLGELEGELVEIEVEEKTNPLLEIFPGQGIEEIGFNFSDFLGNLLPQKKKKRKLTVANARKILCQQEAQKLINMDEVIAEAIEKAENSGIVFIDEIDKIAGKNHQKGPDISREGVQRDILPIVEGSTVMTKYGHVKTDYVQFIAAGAFHMSSPSDLIPELQGRFPIRVELQSLTEEDFKRILSEPHNALIKQYVFLLQTEGVEIEFTDDAIMEVAKAACLLNNEIENIGARRLHTVLEKVFEEISYTAPEILEKKVIINGDYVKNRLEGILVDQDLSRYIL